MKPINGMRHEQYVAQQIAHDAAFGAVYDEVRFEARLALALADLRERRGMSQRDLIREACAILHLPVCWMSNCSGLMSLGATPSIMMKSELASIFSGGRPSTISAPRMTTGWIFPAISTS